MRFVYPIVTSMGFGNNLITLAKAYLIAESCGMRYHAPVWPPSAHMPGSKNGYGSYFPSTISDRMRAKYFSYQYRIQRKLSTRLWPPIVFFHRKDYEKIGVPDVGKACLEHLERLGLAGPSHGLVVMTNGMWGGYLAIKRARVWMEALLLSHANTRRRLAEIENSMGNRLRIGVHIRMGDFLPADAATQNRQGERNLRLPLAWIFRICRQIRKTCDCDIILVTDGTREELLPFLNEFSPIDTIGEPDAALLDLLLLSRSDLVICSNSTYSRIACFLNDRPYVWFADTLIRDPTGKFGYLWKDDGTPMPAWARRHPSIAHLMPKPRADALRWVRIFLNCPLG